MIVREATNDDLIELESFKVGAGSSAWLVEVAEIVHGLLGWRSDPDATVEDRCVIVAVADNQVVGVAAYMSLLDGQGRPLLFHRYLMVVAVRDDQRRTGCARYLTESVLADLQAAGIVTVEWLVHPANSASIAFSRTVFPEADETQPPEDRPYVCFVVGL